jgi:hypothetical protein
MILLACLSTVRKAPESRQDRIASSIDAPFDRCDLAPRHRRRYRNLTSRTHQMRRRARHVAINLNPPIGQPLDERSLSGRYWYPIYEMITEYDTPTISPSTRAATRIPIARAQTI